MNVLIVDDQRSMRLLAASVVDSMGHQSTAVASGEEAIELCRGQNFDVVLMDVEMPGLSGFHTAQAIRREHDHWFPIIFISAKTDPRFFVEGIRSGGDIYLYKPIVPEVLESMINAMARISSYQRELHEAKIKMEILAHRDRLTGVLNRRGFENAMELEVARLGGATQALSVVLLDVDQFKQYNDNYGHAKGDECLKQVADVLTASICRQGDLVARHGGEEFILLLPETNLEQARIVADRVLTRFASVAIEHNYSSVARYVTVSGGVAEMLPGDGIEQVISAADKYLYAAKAQGRNRFVSELESKST